MGGQQSNVVNANKAIDRQDSVPSDQYVDISVAEDVLIDILSFVPYEDLIHNCRLVCKEWKEIIDGQSVWKLKCERRNIKVPKWKSEEIPDNYYRNIYFHELSKGNLIKNACGEEKLDHWNVLEEGGDRFAFENPPKGADPVPEEVGSQSCFATSYYECRKFQIIDLYNSKTREYLLKHNAVKIKVGEWYAARFDCASEYELIVTLLDDSRNNIEEFKFNFSEEQWNGREWHLVTHEFDNVSSSKARYVSFEHSGKDSQFWAGHYGIKMTGAFVELILR